MLASLFGFTAVAYANYNANLVGKVTNLMTYSGGNVLFTLSNQPTSDGSCNASYFELSLAATSSQSTYNIMYAKLAEAYALSEQIDIGYSTEGYMPVYRIG